MRIPSGLEPLNFAPSLLLMAIFCSCFLCNFPFRPIWEFPFSGSLACIYHSFFLWFSHFLFLFSITFEKYSAPVRDAGFRIYYHRVQSCGWLTVYNLRFSPQRPLVRLWCTIAVFASGKILLPVSFIPAPVSPFPAVLPLQNLFEESLTRLFTVLNGLIAWRAFPLPRK